MPFWATYIRQFRCVSVGARMPCGKTARNTECTNSFLQGLTCIMWTQNVRDETSFGLCNEDRQLG